MHPAGSGRSLRPWPILYLLLGSICSLPGTLSAAEQRGPTGTDGTTATADQADHAGEAAAEYGELSVLETYKDRDTRSGHVSLGVLGAAMERYFDRKERLLEESGFNYMIEISPQFQWELGSGTGTTANNEANFIGQWALLDHSNFKRGGLMGWVQRADTLGNTTTEFQQEIGAIIPVNGGDTFPDDSRTALMLLAWEQWFLDDRLRIDVGKLTTRVLLDLNRYAVSDREDFFTPVVVNNLVVPYTARIAPGAFAQYKRDGWHLSGMARNADGTSQWLDLSNLDSGNWEYAAELALTPKNFLGLGQGYYRFIPYYTDSIGEGDSMQPSGWTWSLSFDQDIGDRLGAAFRYAYAEKPFRALQESASLSFQVKQPFGFENDRIGMSLFWGKPSDPELNDETGVELFWKLQISPAVEITPGVQAHFSPALIPGNSTAWVGELRLRVVL